MHRRLPTAGIEVAPHYHQLLVLTLKLRMLKAEVRETLLYGCVTWTLGKEHSAELRTAHHRFLLRIIGVQRRQHTDHRMSYAKALKKAQRESVETTIRKRRLLFAGVVYPIG